MKIISDAEYKSLILKSSTKEIDEVKRLHEVELNKLKEGKGQLEAKHQRTLDNLKEDHRIAMERKDAAQDIVIQKATKELEAKVQKLTIENESNKKEVDILTKAFANLGFDVKDMKEILNKLVDGIVSKNQIQLVK